ncbi:hypothetical protein ABEW19_28230 [Paenibacillus illinoisensis]|uniref:hypothetical protein n=1 Tax=Paenibacillus illinoisensis TaxID=59845 RepID=UPI003D27707E
MLNDYERKVLRILYNYKGIRRRFPTIHELTVKTGRGKADIMAALQGLIAANYITWVDKSDTANIVILEGWQRENEQPKPPATSQFERSNDISYWTEY